MILLQNAIFIITYIMYHTSVKLQSLCKTFKKKRKRVILRKITFFFKVKLRIRQFTQVILRKIT